MALHGCSRDDVRETRTHVRAQWHHELFSLLYYYEQDALRQVLLTQPQSQLQDHAMVSG